MDRYQHILGCLLGTALGDAVGLRREGLSRERADRMYGGPPLRPSLILGRGFCSDDTEHTQMVGRALAFSGGDVRRFELELCRQLKIWLLTIPAGIGLATLRACIRLVAGYGPAHSGVYSAGNGPAMRSALIGLCPQSEANLKEFVHSSTRVTHTDERAEEGALLVARAASLTANDPGQSPIEFLRQSAAELQGDELRRCVSDAVRALESAKTALEFATSQGWHEGVSGYVNQTVPAALYCWASSPNDFRRTVESAVLLGGDADSVGAIAGAVCGANLGSDSLPQDWLDCLSEWPRTLDWMRQLAGVLSQTQSSGGRQSPPPMHWLATVPRNIVIAIVVLGIGFRRLLPPY